MADFEYEHTLEEIKEWVRSDDLRTAIKLDSNKRNMDSNVIRPNDPSFYGASYKESVRQLFDGVDNFNDWLSSSPPMDIPTKSIRRRRVYSDSSGEIDMDRRWDDYPFETFHHVRFDNPIVKVYINGGFRGMVHQRHINAYGMKIYSIINALETAGKMCEIYLYYNTLGITGGNELTFTTVKIKGSDEYVDGKVLATCFTSFFYRRFIFALRIKDADSRNETASWGMGSSQLYKHTLLQISEAGDTIWLEATDPANFDGSTYTKAVDEILEKVIKGRDEISE